MIEFNRHILDSSAFVGVEALTSRIVPGIYFKGQTKEEVIRRSPFDNSDKPARTESYSIILFNPAKLMD